MTGGDGSLERGWHAARLRMRIRIIPGVRLLRDCVLINVLIMWTTGRPTTLKTGPILSRQPAIGDITGEDLSGAMRS